MKMMWIILKNLNCKWDFEVLFVSLLFGTFLHDEIINYVTYKYTYNINSVIISRTTPKTALLQLLFGLSFWDISPPQLWQQHRQQQKHKPTIGINRQNKIPIPTVITIPKA